jgi:hypothetical protein
VKNVITEAQKLAVSAIYIGCYKNEGGDRNNAFVDGKRPKSIASCRELALSNGKAYFGMEYPQGSNVPGEAECKNLDSAPPMTLAADTDCEHEVFEGHPMGSSFRLAIYSSKPMFVSEKTVGAQGSNECPTGSHPLNEGDCLRAVQTVLPPGKVQGRKQLVVGSWPNVAPGCSYQSTGDNAAHYNKHPLAENDGGYMPVCEKAPEAALPTDYLMSGCRRTEIETDPTSLKEMNGFMSPLGMSLDKCFRHCREKDGMKYFAIASGTVCWCSKEPPGTEVGEANCDVKCAGDPNQYCGGVANAASVNVMIDCADDSQQEENAKARNMKLKLVNSYSKFEGQSCAMVASDHGSVISGSLDECKVACWEQKDPCHGFTYDSTRSKCTFTSDVLDGEVKKAATLSCFFKKVGYKA